MKIRIENGLSYISVTLTYQGKEITFDKVLLDTGSMGTIFSIDKVDSIDIRPEANDTIREIYGIGAGREYVFSKIIDQLTSGELSTENFEVEIGAMNYGIEMDGICGLDFLVQSEAMIDFEQLELTRRLVRSTKTATSNPPHPGQVIQEEILAPLSLSVSQLAQHLGIQGETLSVVLNKRGPMTAELAYRLSLLRGPSAESWLRQQAAYELWQVKQHLANIQVIPIK